MTADLLLMNDGAARRRAAIETNSSNHERVNEKSDEGVEEVEDAAGDTAMQDTAFGRTEAKARMTRWQPGTTSILQAGSLQS